MNEDVRPMPPEPDPRAAALQRVADCEQRLVYTRGERDRAIKRVEKAEEELSTARAAAADLLGVRETEMAGIR